MAQEMASVRGTQHGHGDRAWTWGTDRPGPPSPCATWKQCEGRSYLTFLALVSALIK